MVKQTLKQKAVSGASNYLLTKVGGKQAQVSPPKLNMSSPRPKPLAYPSRSLAVLGSIETVHRKPQLIHTQGSAVRGRSRPQVRRVTSLSFGRDARSETHARSSATRQGSRQASPKEAASGFVKEGPQDIEERYAHQSSLASCGFRPCRTDR